MHYYRDARVAPTTGGGSRPHLSSLSANQSYFIVNSLSETRALPHLPLSSAPRAAAPFPSGALPRDHFQPLGIHVPGTHLGDPRARLSPRDFREPMGRSIREPYREPIGAPLWDRMRVRDHGQDAVRRDLQWELVLRDRDRLSSHVPFFHHLSQPQQQVFHSYFVFFIKLIYSYSVAFMYFL